MSQFYSAQEVALRGNLPYIRVLTACRNGELSTMRIGPSYVIAKDEAEAYIAEQQKLADPAIIRRLEARIAELEAQLEKRVA